MPRPPRQQRPAAAEAVIHLALLPVLAGVLVAAPVGVLVLAMPPLLLLLPALLQLLRPQPPPRLPALACQCSLQSRPPLAAHCCSRCAPPTPAVVNPQAS